MSRQGIFIGAASSLATLAFLAAVRVWGSPAAAQPAAAQEREPHLVPLSESAWVEREPDGTVRHYRKTETGLKVCSWSGGQSYGCLILSDNTRPYAI